MSDGPHRSLDMRRGWKQLAERADKNAFAPEEVSDALPTALEQDWRAEVSASFARQVLTILGDRQSSLFGDQRSEQLEALRGEAAGYSLASAFLDYAIQAAARGLSGDEAAIEAACNALFDWATRCARQVEEHYHRESTRGRAIHVRKRIESGMTRPKIARIAKRLIGTDKSERPRASAKQAGLDDGVKR